MRLLIYIIFLIGYSNSSFAECTLDIQDNNLKFVLLSHKPVQSKVQKLFQEHKIYLTLGGPNQFINQKKLNNFNIFPITKVLISKCEEENVLEGNNIIKLIISNKFTFKIHTPNRAETLLVINQISVPEKVYLFTSLQFNKYTHFDTEAFRFDDANISVSTFPVQDGLNARSANIIVYTNELFYLGDPLATIIRRIDENTGNEINNFLTYLSDHKSRTVSLKELIAKDLWIASFFSELFYLPTSYEEEAYKNSLANQYPLPKKLLWKSSFGMSTCYTIVSRNNSGENLATHLFPKQYAATGALSKASADDKVFYEIVKGPYTSSWDYSGKYYKIQKQGYTRVSGAKYIINNNSANSGRDLLVDPLGRIFIFD
ncbi:MAG: hypothetical protein KDD40_04925 [Bdellovibrionales bacterium]|nr:hypothetical protein [Bdellovibrionales bacterium]